MVLKRREVVVSIILVHFKPKMSSRRAQKGTIMIALRDFKTCLQHVHSEKAQFRFQ